ncbi:MAG: energy transducer TonB [Ignavibacteriales bacterium]|nr:energy transducer TonB [Ignavibacteriales bacterium]
MLTKITLKNTLQFTLLFIFTFFQVYTLTSASSPKFLPGDEEYAAFAEEMPSPIGGMGSIQKLISYPTIAKQAGIEGKVYVLAYINDKGGVDDVKMIKGIGAGCDEATIEAVKKCKFTPGKNKGAALKVKLSLAINFKLN